MASFNLTVEDSSPLILYSPSGAWSDATNDPSLSSYSGNSFHTTTSQGAAATINFNGTGLSIFGGLRSNYGTYSITVDGQNVTSASASSPEAAFKQLLGSATGLANDFVDIESQVGSSGSRVTNTTIDDNDARMSYQPPNAWQLNSNEQFIDGTLHFTNVANATASLSFSGDAVALWGTVSPDHANIRVTLDGETTIYNGGSGGTVSTLHSQILLFFANNLGAQQHTLVVSPDQEQNTGLFVDVDAVQVFSATATNALPVATTSATRLSSSSTTLLSTSSPDQVASRKTMPAGTVASIVLGVLLAILAIVAVIFVLLRQRRRKAGSIPKVNEKVGSPKTPELPLQLEGGFNSSPTLMPHPAAFPTRARMFPKAKSRESTFTISSYYTSSRPDSTATASTVPMLRSDVPIIKVPKPPRAPNSPPVRPSQRPPSLELS